MGVSEPGFELSIAICILNHRWCFPMNKIQNEFKLEFVDLQNIVLEHLYWARNCPSIDICHWMLNHKIYLAYGNLGLGRTFIANALLGIIFKTKCILAVECLSKI